MSTSNKKAISTLNDLIETLKDGQKGFAEAAEGVQDPQLRSLFTEYLLRSGCGRTEQALDVGDEIFWLERLVHVQADVRQQFHHAPRGTLCRQNNHRRSS